jgi:hypothetical protein
MLQRSHPPLALDELVRHDVEWGELGVEIYPDPFDDLRLQYFVSSVTPSRLHDGRGLIRTLNSAFLRLAVPRPRCARRFLCGAGASSTVE